MNRAQTEPQFFYTLAKRMALMLRASDSGRYREFQATYFDKPDSFVHDCFRWNSEDDGPTFYQEHVLSIMPTQKRVCVRGPHGLGKTTMESWILWWYALTRDAREDSIGDWKVVTTASVGRQLTRYLWPEIHKWYRRLKWDIIGLEPLNRRDELMRYGLRLKSGEASAASPGDVSAIEGAHADNLLYIFDESKAVKDEVFDAAEGAFSSTGDAYALACSTPGEPFGRFYDIQSRKAGYEDWTVIHVTLDDAIKAGRIKIDWARQRRIQWGEDSALYLNRVLGEFAQQTSNSVIPLSWVEAAVNRWDDWADQFRDTKTRKWVKKPDLRLISVGVDVAYEGDDKSVIAPRYEGDIFGPLSYFEKQDPMEIAAQCALVLAQHINDKPKPYAVVDTIGLGAGTHARLVEEGYDSRPFVAGASTSATDASEEIHFINTRSAAWWHARELLDPANNPTIALPNDPLLIGDLTAPTWKPTAKGQIQIEAKADIKRRLKRSTDSADAVIQALWAETRPKARVTTVVSVEQANPWSL